MNIKEVSKEGLVVLYEVSLSTDELTKIKTSKLNEIAARTNIQGFRPGKAPLDMVEAQNKSKIASEVLEEATNGAIDKIYNDNKLHTVSSPKVNIIDFAMDKGLSATVEIELFPEIGEVPFEGITLDRNIIEVSQKEIDESLDKIANYYKSFEDMVEDRATKNGDVVVIDFIGKIDNKEFDGGKGADFPLELGSSMFIPGFEEQLIGKKALDKIIVTTKFPDNYHAKHLAGKETIFDVTIKKVQQVIKAPIDDELAKKSGFDNLEGLKKDITGKYQEQVEMLESNNLKKQLIEKLYDIKDFQLPKSLIDAEKEALWTQFSSFKSHMLMHKSTNDFASHGHTQADIDYCEKDETEVKKDHELEAKKRIKLALLLNDVSFKNSIQVEEADIHNMLHKESMIYGKDANALLAQYQSNKDSMKALKNRVLEDKIMSFILAKVKYTDKNISFNEYTNKLVK